MNDAAGGNARWGENEITAYPWAAHYVPVPGPKAIYVRELFEDLGVLQDGQWNERYLCFSPQERLFLYGRWQEGIEPAIGLKPKDREQFQRLEDLFTKYRSSGEFTIPLELGRSNRLADLDRISFSEWLRQQNIDSPLVNWYMNYACRDDYGALAKDTSAWAGIHYFSSREAEEKGPLTWPEGNGWITRRLLERVGENVRTNQMVHRITPSPRGVTVEAGDTQFQSEFVIFAAPTFLAPYIVDNFAAAPRFRLLAVAHRKLNARSLARRAWRRANVGHRLPRLTHARIRRRHAPEHSLAHRQNRLDVLLGVSRRRSRAKSAIPAGERLGVLEGSNSSRPGKSPLRYPEVRFANRHHAHGPRHGPARSGVDFLSRAPASGKTPRPDLVCKFRCKWNFYLRGSAIPRREIRGRNSATHRRKKVIH